MEKTFRLNDSIFQLRNLRYDPFHNTVEVTLREFRVYQYTRKHGDETWFVHQVCSPHFILSPKLDALARIIDDKRVANKVEACKRFVEQNIGELISNYRYSRDPLIRYEEPFGRSRLPDPRNVQCVTAERACEQCGIDLETLEYIKKSPYSEG